MKVESYESLIVWQKSMDLVIAVYALTGKFPKEEIYGLTSQMRRAAVSIPSNIAEGSRRGSRKDFRHFLLNAYGSGAELETQIKIARRLAYGEAKDYEQVNALLDEVMRMLNKFSMKLQTTTYSLQTNKGFSLIEVLLSVALFALVVTALVGAVIYGRESTAVAGARARAIAIAEEGLEAARNIRDASFATLADGNHGLAISANQWVFSGTSDVVDNFTRQVMISTPSTNRRQTVSTVTWQQTPSRTGSVVLTTYHTNWRASGGGGASTCLQFCTSIGYTDATCRPAATTCEAHGEVHEPVGDPICVATSPGTALCCCKP